MQYNLLNKRMNIWLSGTIAGMFIAIASIMYLSVENKEVGALLFGAALLFISVMGFDLYTGKVGQPRYTKYLPYMLGGNLAGAIIIGTLMGACNTELSDAALTLVMNKAFAEPWMILFKGFMCGVLMFSSVMIYRSFSAIYPIIGVIGIILGVYLFVACGFEHCIADTVYIAISLTKNPHVWNLAFYSLIGNTLGSCFMSQVVFVLMSGNKK